MRSLTTKAVCIARILHPFPFTSSSPPLGDTCHLGLRWSWREARLEHSLQTPGVPCQREHARITTLRRQPAAAGAGGAQRAGEGDLTSSGSPPAKLAPEGDMLRGSAAGCPACAGLPTGLGACGHKVRGRGRYWWQPPVAGATQRRAFAPSWQVNLERERTEDKARHEEHKIRPRSLAAVSPHWFLKTKQVWDGWILSKRWCLEVAVQNILLGAHSDIVLAGPEGSKIRPNTLSTILFHKHK